MLPRFRSVMLALVTVVVALNIQVIIRADEAPPGLQSLLTPVGGGNSVTPTFAWVLADGADSVLLALDDLSLDERVIDVFAPEGTSFVPAPLADNHTFRAWICGVNAYGQGPWTTQDFATGNGPLSAPGAQTLTRTGWQWQRGLARVHLVAGDLVGKHAAGFG